MSSDEPVFTEPTLNRIELLGIMTTDGDGDELGFIRSERWVTEQRREEAGDNTSVTGEYPNAADINKRLQTEGNNLVGESSCTREIARGSCKTGERIKLTLPPRLFATDRYPREGRINSYSNAELLFDIAEILEGSLEMEWLKSSCFGRLFDLPIRKCCLSGKLVHQFLSRSLVTRKKHELWFVFGGYPIRFSLKEFALVTGLNCEPFLSERDNWEMEIEDGGGDEYWHELMGPEDSYNISDILDILKGGEVAGGR